MKQIFLTLVALSLFGIVEAQKIPNSQVPSVVLNHFKIQFSKAKDIEWKINGDLYLVDFEMPKNMDHEIWYNASGKIVKQKIEILKEELPAAVVSRVNSDFKGYRIEEAKKITTDSNVHYELDLVAFMKREWKVTLDENGKILNKVAD